MGRSTYFTQECPTCGRSLHIRVEYLGKGLMCQHCRGRLVASDQPLTQAALTDSGSALLRRAEELLELAEQRRQLPR